jgi:aspartate racemase
MKMIGIVGGVGPFAGVDLTRKIFSQTRAGRDQDHLPVVLLSVPGVIADRTEYLMGRAAENPAYPVSRLILNLEQSGANVVGIPCNTMHAPEIFGVIEDQLKRQGSRVVVLNMIWQVVAFIREHHPHWHKIGVLSTTGTWKKQLYAHSLAAAGFQPVVLPQEIQQRVHAAVYDPRYGVKARSSPVTDKARNRLLEAVAFLHEKGAEGVVLGCTEMPWALPYQAVEGVPLLDANLILARALIGHSYPDRLGPLEAHH